MGLFGLFGKKRKPEDTIIANMEKMGQTLLCDMKKQFMDVIEVQRKQLRDTQEQLKTLQDTMENEKPVYILKGSFFLHPRKKRGTLVLKCNSDEFLDKLKDILNGSNWDSSNEGAEAIGIDRFSL